MAGMAVHFRKWLNMVRNGWNGQKWLKMAGHFRNYWNGWKWLEMAGNGLKLLEKLEIA